MNVIKAMKSGRRFKRPCHENWYGPFVGVLVGNILSAEDEDTLFINGLFSLATDWEVEAAPVTITREQFDAAWRRALDVSENMEIKTQHYLYELVVRELGL